MHERIAGRETLAAKLVMLLASLALAISLAPPALASAAEITGSSPIDSNGTYELATGATGTITIGENLDVTIVGKGATEKFSGLNFQVGDSTVVTIKDLYADQGKDASTINFLGDGTLKTEGENLIDNDGGLNAAVIHVAAGKEVHFDGAGTLYGYKSALCSYIGGNSGEANGKIVFDGGYWFLKGTKTGAVIGGDSSSDKGGDIVINGGELYVKGVARGALIGGSNQGKSGDVYVNGGLVELFEDFSGPAIGAGIAANAGNVYVSGGSLKPILSSNSSNSYGAPADFNGLPYVSWDAVKALNASDYAVLAFDASAYISNLETDTVSLYLDGSDSPFYSGRAYTYVTNEVKNPSDITGTTKDNWLANDESWLVTVENYGSSAYPDKNGSSLVPEKNLYLALSKENHILTVGDDTYAVIYDSESNSFTYTDMYKAVAAPLVDGAEGSTFVVPDDYGITQTASDNEAGYKDVAVKFAATGLAKHTGTTGEMPEGYWVGVGIPSVLGSTYAVGFGDYSADATWDGEADASFTEDGATYNTFYFSVPTATDRQKGYVAVKNGDEVAAVYTLDFSDVKLLNAVTPTAADNGDIVLSTESATGAANEAISVVEGETVTVTVEPAEGYVAKGVTYEFGDETANATATDAENTFTFTMPAQPVTVTAKIILTPVTTIETAADLAAFAEQVNAGMDYADTTVTLAADIDLSGYEDWTPIGTSSAAFKGTFDGAGHEISGLSITSKGGYKGLFGNNAGTVKDFTVSGTLGTEDNPYGGGSKDFWAAAVAFNTGTVSGVINKANLYMGSGDTYAVGGVVGKNQGGTVYQCGNEGAILSDVSKSIYRTGGIVGFQSAGSISECYNIAEVSAWNYRNGDQGTGGILGSMEGGTVSFCYNTANVYNGDGSSSLGGKQGAGGIVGAISSGSVNNCYSVGSAYGPGSAGVIIGKLGNGAYDHLFSLDTARSWQQYGTKTENGIKYCDGTDENADGSLKFGGAALANSYNSGYTITNSYTFSADVLKSAAMVLRLNSTADGGYAAVFAKDANGGYPVLAWQGGKAVDSVELTASSVSGIDSQYAYDADGQTPVIAVDDTTLVAGLDYTVAYKTAGGTDVATPIVAPGSYVATVAGTGTEGGFYGTATIEFTIMPSADMLTIADIDDQVFTGSAIKPPVSITYTDADGNEVALVQGTDFSLKCKNNKNVGEATATIVGSDACEFTVTKTFNIVAKSLASGFTIADIDDQLATGSAIEPAITLTDDETGATLVEDEDYILTYYSNTAVGTAKVKATGLGNYTGSTKAKNFKIICVAMDDATVSAASKAYTGKALKPEVTVTYNGATLPSSVYTVSYDDEFVNVGTYKITVTGDGIALDGTATCTFEVTKIAQSITASNATVVFGKTASLSAKLAKGDGSLTYATSNAKVATVDANGTIKGVKAGTAKITVTAAATDNYAKATKTVKVTVSKAANTMTAKAKSPKVTFAKLKKKNQTIAVKKAITVSKAQGKVTYAKASGNKKITVAKTGKITVKKGLKKGTYSVKIKVTAAGGTNYKSATKTVTVKVKVK